MKEYAARYTKEDIQCRDSRKCFAKKIRSDGKAECSILSNTGYKDGECPFCKPMVWTRINCD